MALRKILASIIASVWLPLDGSGTLYGQPVEEGKIYWTDPRAGTIHRADLDGANVETLLTGLEDPGYIALDVVWYYLYDPCPVCITGTPPDSSPDPDRRTAAKTAASVGAPTKMYWTERSGKSHTIRRSNLDGSNVETGTRSSASLGEPSSGWEVLVRVLYESSPQAKNNSMR